MELEPILQNLSYVFQIFFCDLSGLISSFLTRITICPARMNVNQSWPNYSTIGMRFLWRYWTCSSLIIFSRKHLDLGGVVICNIWWWGSMVHGLPDIYKLKCLICAGVHHIGYDGLFETKKKFVIPPHMFNQILHGVERSCFEDSSCPLSLTRKSLVRLWQPFLLFGVGHWLKFLFALGGFYDPLEIKLTDQVFNENLISSSQGFFISSVYSQTSVKVLRCSRVNNFWQKKSNLRITSHNIIKIRN